MLDRKIILFGGTFDPIHIGHAEVSDFALKHIDGEKVIFIPAKQSPLKKFSPKASDEDRLNMTALAVNDNPKFEVSDYEINKTGFSYTLETVRRFKTKFGKDTTLYWLIGADAVKELRHWYKIEELIDACELCVMYRAGCHKPDFSNLESAWGKQRIQKMERNVIETPLINLSSTEIRKRIADGEDVSEMLHPKVLEYIDKHRLYR